MKTEKGQVLILIVGLLLSLIAVTSLAVDLGHVYGQKRAAQNAADNASLQAAVALCSGANVANAAVFSALENGFNNNGIDNTVSVHNPPLTGDHSLGGTDDDEYVEVIISSILDPGFTGIAALTSPGATQLETTARSVARCHQTAFAGAGYAQVVLDAAVNCSFAISGNGHFTVNGGSMQIDSSAGTALCASGNATINTDLPVTVTGSYSQTGNAHITPNPVIGSVVLGDPLNGIIAPPAEPYQSDTCVPMNIGNNSNQTIGPGKYCYISISGNATATLTAGNYWIGSFSASSNAKVTMGPGIYYIHDGDFTTVGNAQLTATEVMFYLADGDFDIDGNGKITITAPKSGTYQGMMLYIDPTNNADVTFAGNAIISTTGTIYGANSTLNISGNGNSTVLNTQVIVKKVNITGNGIFTQNYDQDDNYSGGGGSGGGGGGNSYVSLAE